MAGIEGARRPQRTRRQPAPEPRGRCSKARLDVEFDATRTTAEAVADEWAWMRDAMPPGWAFADFREGDAEFDALLEASSLGSPIAKHLRELGADTDEEDS